MSYTAPGKWKTAVRRDAPRRLKPFLLLLGDQAGRDGTVRNLTRTSIAEQFDVDTRTIQRWLKDCYSARVAPRSCSGARSTSPHRSTDSTIPCCSGRHSILFSGRHFLLSLKQRSQGDTCCLPYIDTARAVASSWQ